LAIVRVLIRYGAFAANNPLFGIADRDALFRRAAGGGLALVRWGALSIGSIPLHKSANTGVSAQWQPSQALCWYGCGTAKHRMLKYNLGDGVVRRVSRRQ